MQKLLCKFDEFARKHKWFWLDEERWYFINEGSWDNRFRVKYLNHLNSNNPIYKIGDMILRLIGCCY